MEGHPLTRPVLRDPKPGTEPYSDRPLDPPSAERRPRLTAFERRLLSDAAARSGFRDERRRFIGEALDRYRRDWDRDPEDLLWERVDRGEV